MNKLFLIALLGSIAIAYVAGHGMVLDPVNRSSRWRYDSTAEPNYDDNQLWCGGLGPQHNIHGGKCGLCGDVYSDPMPRANEHAGRFGKGVIVGSYRSGGILPVGIMITTNHKGYFRFNLCNMDGSRESEACFDANPLKLENGADRYDVTEFRNGMFNVNLRLPTGLTCKQCVLQWTYVTGNTWGQCEDGTSGLGCGPQEHFRTCSDISITWNVKEATGHVFEEFQPYLEDTPEEVIDY